MITGENGSGKTSLLEAIGYASTLQSFRRSPRESLIRQGATRAYVRAEVENEGRSSLVEVEILPERRDQVLLNRQKVTRSEQLLDTLRVTVFTPDDLILVKGGPAERRAFLDDVLVSAQPKLSVLRQTVDRVLRQRATLLKQSGGRLTPEVSSSLDVWDVQLAHAGGQLVARREELVQELQAVAQRAFAHLARSGQLLSLSYRRSFGDDLAAALARTRADDVRRGITTIGPHRDELFIGADSLDVRTRLSQGRQRVVTLALRLAAHQVVTDHAGAVPALLLDDAFSELDEATAAALVEELPAGQAILTTAGPVPPVLGVVRSSLRLEGGELRV